MPTLVACFALVAMVVWHMRTRRHPGWQLSRDGRYFISLGYPLLMIGIYWLVEAPNATTWEWVLGYFWPLAAMVTFVHGFGALDSAVYQQQQQQQQASASTESVEPPAKSVADRQ